MPVPHVPASLPHVIFDPLLIATFVGLSIYEARWYWPRMVRRMKAGEPGARIRAYRNIVIVLWLGVAWVAALWLVLGRPWSALRLGGASLGRLAIGFGFAALYIGLAAAQRRALLAKPQVLARLRQRFEYAEPLIPRTQAERGMFVGLSLSAGICEEVIYRGFMMWYFGTWGPVAAVVLSSVVFGLGHLYIGFPHVIRTTVLGAVFALIVWLSGSLLPCIVLHAAIDWFAGDLGYHAYTGGADRAHPEPQPGVA
jgi:CAAX protease family protein